MKPAPAWGSWTGQQEGTISQDTIDSTGRQAGRQAGKPVGSRAGPGGRAVREPQTQTQLLT